MEFLGVGYQEVLLILVLMLVVVGPERLPKMAYQMGRAVRTLQGYARMVRDEFQGEMSYLEEEIALVKGEVDGAKTTLKAMDKEMKAQQRQLDAELQQASGTVQKELQEAEKDAAAALPKNSHPAPATKTAASAAAKPTTALTSIPGKKSEPEAADTEDRPAPPLVF